MSEITPKYGLKIPAAGGFTQAADIQDSFRKLDEIGKEHNADGTHKSINTPEVNTDVIRFPDGSSTNTASAVAGAGTLQDVITAGSTANTSTDLIVRSSDGSQELLKVHRLLGLDNAGLPDLLTLRTKPVAGGFIVKIDCHTTLGDLGGGTFRGVTGAAAGTYADNNGTVIVPTGGDGSAAWLRENIGYVTPEMFGAIGDGVADDAAAIQNAHDSSEGGMVFSAGKTYNVQSTVVFSKSNYHIDMKGSTITTNTTGVNPVKWSDTQFMFGSSIKNGSIKGGLNAGHTMTIGYGFSQCTLDVELRAINPASSIIDATFGGTGGIYDSTLGGSVWGITTSHTVHAVNIVNTVTGTCNGITWAAERFDRSGSKQFFNIECSASGNWCYDNKWRDSTWEVTIGGNIRATGARGFVIENQRTWDLIAGGGGTVNHIYDFGKEVGGLNSTACIFRNVGRTDGVLGAGLYDVNLESGAAQDFVFDTCVSSSGLDVKVNLSNNRALIIENVRDLGATYIGTGQANRISGIGGDLSGLTMAAKLLSIENGGTLVVSAGSITVDGSRYTIDTEALAATDNLVNISGGVDGQILMLRAINDGRTVVVKHGVGNIRLNGQSDFVMDSAHDVICLEYLGSGNKWLEISRSSNGL